jgi:tyrosine-protein phosphatase YwqE
MEDRMLTDLHCHILPGIDDGAQTSAIARKLLEEEKKQETGQIMFTPHYYSWMGSAEDFREKRDKAAEITAPILKELGISWNTGAEVRMDTGDAAGRSAMPGFRQLRVSSAGMAFCCVSRLWKE